MRHLDLFSGIGGFALGLEMAGGFETVGFCEREEYCKKLLKQHWPGVPVFDDITELKGDEAGAIDIITGGFPCQPFSFAGKRKGANDDRALWPEMLRIIEKAKPTWVIGENVAGIISMEFDELQSGVESRTRFESGDYTDYEAIHIRETKMYLDQCCEDLEQIGYEVQPFVIPACAVDAPHRRDRVWIIAHADCAELRDSERNGEECKATSELGDDGEKRTFANSELESRHDVANTNTNSVSVKRIERKELAAQERKESRERQARSQSSSNPRQWPVTSSVRGLDDGLSERLDKVGGRLNEKSRHNEILPVLQEKFSAQEDQRQAGGQNCFSETQILQQVLHGSVNEKRISDAFSHTKADQWTQKDLLQYLQNYKESSNSSQGRGLDEQQRLKLGDALLIVSHITASRTRRHHSEEDTASLQGLWKAIISLGVMQYSLNEIQAAWKSISDKEKDWAIMAACFGQFHSEFPDTKRVVNGLPNRSHRIKGLGNAIVPRIVEVIAKNIIKVDELYRAKGAA